MMFESTRMIKEWSSKDCKIRVYEDGNIEVDLGKHYSKKAKQEISFAYNSGTDLKSGYCSKDFILTGNSFLISDEVHRDIGRTKWVEWFFVDGCVGESTNLTVDVCVYDSTEDVGNIIGSQRTYDEKTVKINMHLEGFSSVLQKLKSLDI